MAYVYVLYSKKLDRYYIGSCLDLKKRLEEHQSGKYKKSFTAKATDWELIFNIDALNYKQARKVEVHIKKMKSRKFIVDLIKYPEIRDRLIDSYK